MNETIYLGSSAQGVSGGTMYLRSPSGVLYPTGASATGRINNRLEEVTGPIAGGYTPFKHLAEESGVWSVFFIGSTSNPQGPGRVDSNTNWPTNNGGDNSGDVAAFDVSVSLLPAATVSTDFIKGRAYMNVFGGRLWTFNGLFNGKFQVLTNDGYNYEVDANGLAGNAFVFFSNNKGYRKADGTASYKSENSTTTANLHDPRLIDNISTNDITHKLFFNIPDSNLPATAPIRSNNGKFNDVGTLSTTWLKSTPVLPVIQNFSFAGIEGTSGQAGIFPLSGYIKFESNQPGTYTITIDVDNNGPTAKDVTLTGSAIAGTNQVLWDGKDKTGAIVQGTLNASSITVGLKAGEVHFPYIDVENNPSGIKITRAGGGVGPTTVYWDDSNITVAGTPSNPITELNGVNSVNNGHKWGSSSYYSWDFGDTRGLDTWAYLLSAPIVSGAPVRLKKADLQLVSLTSNKISPVYCIGETITYTVLFKNNGPDDVSEAKIAFNFPSELTLTAIPSYTTSGTVSIVEDVTTTTKVSAVVDMSNQATITLTVTGTVNAQPAGGSLLTSASILRPADVTDPDATNPDNLPPTDPVVECNAGTVGCNNIVYHSATIPLSDITIVATSASKSEGNSPGTLTDMTFTVSLSAANAGCPVTVNYTLQHTTSNASDFDFTAPYPGSGTLTFAPGETSKVLTFKVRQDLMVEANETFSVVLSSPSSGGKITTPSATGTIDNDDTITQIGITKVDGAEGGANGSFTFTFPGGASFDVDTPVPYTLTGTAAGGGTDYTAAGTSGTITIPAGSNSVTLDLAVNNDGLTEGSETVIITPGVIGNIYNASVTVITPVPVVTIADNDPATLTISNASIIEGDSGTQALTFNVTLSNPTGSAFNINYATANGTALAGEDYVAKSGTLTFTGPAETQTITIQINGDQKIEPNELFTIALSGLTNTFSGQLTVVGSPATGTITDNDNTPANRVITITSTNGQELGPVPGIFTFSFPAGVSADQPTTIDFGLTGVAGVADYTGTLPSVTIPAGVNSGTLSLTVLSDDILEGPESVILTTTGITNTAYATTLGNTSQTLYIIDDDAASIITGAVTVVEGNNGLTNMIFNVQLNKATGSSFTIGYTISNGTAIAGEDYTTPSGLFTGTLTFSGTPETQQIIVQVKGDQKIEANETLTLTLGPPSNTFNNLLAVQNSPATGTITDDDNIPTNKIITITKANGYEGIVGSEASFTFSLPNGVTVDSDTEISYTLSGTATGNGYPNADYTGSYIGTIRILAGQNSATLNLPVLDDLMLEGDETVIVTVNGTSNPAYDPFTVSNSGLSLTIVENDNTVLLSSAANVVEGNSGTKTIEFKVTVALATSLPFTVDFHTTNGTALAVEDYVAQSGTMSFAANTPNQVKSIFVTINGDLKIESDETFTVTLDNLSNTFGNTLFLSPPVTMTITDDDDIPVNKIISISKTNGAEPGTDGTFTLSFPTGITADAATTVNYILSGTAQAGGIDYTDTKLTPIMIPAGQNSVTISMIDVADDYIIEGTESVLMTITSVTNPSYAGFAGNAPVALDILDDDNTALNNVITLSKVADGAEPGTKAQFKVSFPPTITASVPTTVNYTISGTATGGLDYTALSGSVVIPAGNSSALINVLVINDQVIEATETVGLTLTGASNSISTLTVGPGLISANIADDDNIPSNNVITLSKVLDGAEPGTNAQFKVSFPSGITSSVDTQVFYTVSPSGTASAGTDYKALTGQVTILAGDNSALIDVEVFDDQVIENTETVLLALSSATNSISTLTVQPTNFVGISITDNDNTVSNNIISINSITNASEPAANGRFTVRYPTGISSSEATLVTYTISGTAVNGTDYNTIPVTVTIPAYANSVDINITVVNDLIIEPTETVGLTLTLANNTSFTPTVNGTLADIDIVDDDNVPANNRIILNAVTGGAEPATPGQFTVGFPAGFTSSNQTIVNYQISGTATSGADYTALTGTVIIPANSGPVPINIIVLNDNIIEGTETVAITLDNATNSIIGSLATLPNSAVSINIEDDEDDDPTDNIITLTKTDGSEPGSNAAFVVSYPAGITSSKNTVINYTVGAGSTATSGTDYTALSGTATILAGNNSATIQVPVIDDQIIELTETVELTISSANNSVSMLTWSPLVALSANIADNDNNLTNNTITLSKVTDGSEPGTAAQFKVSFPSGYTSSALTTVSYTVGGTATAGTDYTALTGTVTIPANSNSALIVVPVLDDLVIEPTETVSLTLTGATNANATMAILPNGSAVIANITDNDNNSSNNNIYLSLVRNGTEGGDNPQFEVSFPAGYSSSEPTVVTYVPTGINTAVLNVDYTVPLSTVTIPAYTNSALIEIPLTNDLILEPTESFQLVLTGATNSVAAGLTYQTSSERADIADDDNIAANNVISLTKVTDGIEAGTPAVFKASFPTGYTSSVATTVNYVVSGGTAISGTDFTVSGQVIIPAGSGSANFDATVLEDQILEATETVQLTLVDATNSIFSPITVNLAPATANIADDETSVAANKLITITPDDGAEVTAPGIPNPANFSFRFPAGITSSAPTIISYVLTGTAGGNGTDFTGPVSGTVTIPAGDNSVSISFPVSDDDIVENSETIILTTGVVSNANVTGISVANSPATLNITDNDAATLTVNNVTVTEGNSGDTKVEFTVTLDKATGGSFSIDYTTGNLSAETTDNDYNAKSETLSFAGNAGEFVKFIIHVNGDRKIEGNETFNVNFTAPTNTFGSRLTMPVPTATGTITNDDSGTITITSNPGSEANPNPNGASFTFSFPPGVSSDQATTIFFGLSVGSTATIADDYVFPALTGSVTIPPGVNSQTITLPVVDDAILESTETITLTVGSVVNPYGITVTTPTVSTTIIDNDAASVSLSVPATVNENAGTATFTVTLTGNVQEAFTVSYATSNGTAIAPGDYTATASGTVSFPAGSVSGATQTFLVTINNDNLVETDETFSATLNSITGLTTITTAGATASTTITDNDAASVAITTNPTVNEAAGTATFTVTLTGNVQEAFAVNYTTSGGSAIAPGDYTHTTGTVNFPVNSPSGAIQTFTVPVVNDNIVESGETFSASLTGITGLTTISTPTATTTITDNDAASVSISTDATINEAAGMATFTVTLTGNVQESFTVNYATSDGGAIAPGDYANTTGSVIFPAGSPSGATKTFTVLIQNDNLTEADETFSATLTAITGLATITTATATTSITDNDVAELSITDVTIVEGGGGTTDMSFTVKLNNATAKPFKIGYTTVDGTATIADHDYEPALTGATLNFNGLANETQRITVKIYGDKKIEANENFKVILGAISGTFDGRLTVNSTQGRATGTITNDDSGEITITKVNGDEQGPVAGSFIFSFPSGVTSDQPVTISYTLGGSATSTASDPDYTGTSTGTVTIAAGDERAILNLPVNDDEIAEDDETVTIAASMSSVYGGVTLNASRPVVTIKDNDVAKLTLSGPVTLQETNIGTTTATFTVTLDKKTTGSFDLKYATADGTAKTGDNDYISNSGILHFAGNAGESYPITIQINGDKKIEQDEIFSLVLSNLSQTFNNRLTVPVTSTTVTIKNDDSGTIVIVPENGSEDGTPGNSPASFTFRFSDPDMTTDVPVTISYGLRGTALSTGTNYDYTASPALGSITLPANAKSVKLNLNVNDDQIVEGTETVILITNTGGLPYGITVSNSPQSLNIADNDGAKLTISNATVTEGNSGTKDITFNVKLDKATGEPFTVTYTTADGTATEGEDYVRRTDVLSFNGTANEIQTITIQVKGDQRIEQNETFTVTLGTLSNLNDILSIPSPEATGTIIDDDHTQIILTKVADGEEPLTNARFKVNFVNAGVTSSEATQVSYTIAGTATNGIDYIALNGNVVIPAGSNEAFIDVEVTDDQLIEPTETVILSLTAASSASFTLPVQATLVSANIKDNDQVALTVSNPVVTEGNNGTVTATFNVILSTGTPNGFTVSYNTTDGTATVADNDYIAVNGTLNFNGTAGETHSISVTVKGDQKIERDETFNMMLNLSNTFGGRLNLIGSPAIGTILDDDNIPANKKITITTKDGMEGVYNGSFTFSLPTGITTDSPTIIPFILAGTAFKNQDYIAMFSSPVIIPAGVSSLTLPVPVIDDDIMEGTETLQMITGGVSNSRYNGITVNTPVPVLNILDNDYSQLTISSPTIKEGNNGGTLLMFEVKLNGATGAGFTVDYTTEDGTATLNDNDYNFVSGTLVFNGTVKGETKTISVWINGDINIEDNENFRVVLSGLSKTFGGALKISEWPGVGTILNDDIQPVASDDIIMTNEDTPVTFSVTGNDADVDGTVNPESIIVVTSTIHGTLLFNPDGTFTYTPEDNYNGRDEFTYKVNDNTGIESNVAKVSIVINAVNDAPVARDDIFYVRKDGSLNATVKANDTDLDGDRLNFTVLDFPKNGKLTSFNPADGSFVYMPDNGFVGIDHFSYRACDAPGLCSAAQVTLYVQPKVTVKLTPSAATITEGDFINITAEIAEPLFQDVEVILNYTGSALQEKDYILEGDYISMVIPAGNLATTQKFTIRSIKDFLKEGDEVVQVRVQSVNPSEFVDAGLGSDILIKDFYPEDKGTDENANGDINPDPLTSPNGDGLGNESFIIHNIERYPDNEVLIFNRWGNKVFQVKGYNNRDKAFGGVANTGLLVNKNSVLVDGVYFYIIYTKDSTGRLRINKGSVIIKR